MEIAPGVKGFQFEAGKEDKVGEMLAHGSVVVTRGLRIPNGL